MKKFLMLSLCVIVIAGCSEDNPMPSPPPGPEPVLPFAGTPAQMMANFQAVYEERNYEWYRDLLHPEFETILQQETTDQFPDVGETLDLLEELRIHERMFSGDDLTDPDGQFVPGMKAIDIRSLFPLEDWTAAKAEDWPAGTVFAPHEVDIIFSRGPEYAQMRVEGQIVFYAVARDSFHEGETRDYYEMIGQVDLTANVKDSETIPWGTAKALFR